MEAIKIVLDLINRSLEGELQLNELYELWPEELAKNEFYETIYDDVESVVEHYPGMLDANFMESKEYISLIADRKLVNLIIEKNPEPSDLLELRTNLLE